MPLPVGTVPIGGPLIDTTAADLAASAALRDAGAISFRGGELRKVNAAGDNWVGVPGHVVGATEPANPFEGQLWYDTAAESLKAYDGSAFIGSGVGTASFYDLNDTPTITSPNNVAGRFLSLNLDDSLDFVFRGESFWTATAVYTQANDTLALTILTDRIGVTAEIPTPMTGFSL